MHASLLLSRSRAALATAGWVGAHFLPKKARFASFMILLGWFSKYESILEIEWGHLQAATAGGGYALI